jgi:hypothetical protein
MTALDDDLDDAPEEQSIDVVLLRRDATGQVIPVHGTTPVDLTATTAPPPAVEQELLESSTVLVAPTGVPVDLVRALLATTAPAAFIGRSWLHEHRALIFVDGRCQVGLHILRHHDEFGVYAEEAQ